MFGRAEPLATTITIVFKRNQHVQKNILRLFWQFSNPYKVRRGLAIFFPVLAVTMNAIAAPYILSRFLDKLQSGNVSLDNSWGLIAIYAGLIFVGEVIIWRLALYFTWTFEVSSQRDLYAAMFDKLTREDIAFHSDRFGGSLVSQTSKMLGAFERFWDMVIWSIVPMVSTIVGSVVILITLGLWQYGLFLICYASAFMVVVILVSRFLANINRREAAANNIMNGFLADMVTNVATVKAFGREKHELRDAKKVADDWKQASFTLRWGVLGATSAFSSMYALGAIAAFLFAVIGAEHGIASVGMVYLIFVYALNINRQLWEMNSITRNYSRVLGDADEMTKILLKDFSLVDRTSTKLNAKRGEVVLTNVRFAHDNGDGEQVFDNFNLSIPAGQRDTN